jgi:hypothetical protein
VANDCSDESDKRVEDGVDTASSKPSHEAVCPVDHDSGERDVFTVKKEPKSCTVSIFEGTIMASVQTA